MNAHGSIVLIPVLSVSFPGACMPTASCRCKVRCCLPDWEKGGEGGWGVSFARYSPTRHAAADHLNSSGYGVLIMWETEAVQRRYIKASTFAPPAR